MDILSLFTSGKGAPVTTDASEDENKSENPLENNTFGEELARSVEGKVVSAEEAQAIAQLDGLAGQQVSAQMIALIGQQENNADTFTREEAEAWVADLLEQEAVGIDLSILDREKIIQILLGIEEEPIEEAEASAEAETQDELSAQERISLTNETIDAAQERISLTNETIDAVSPEIALAANDNSLEAGYIEVVPVVQDIMTVVPVATVTIAITELSNGLTLADAAITQAMAKAREAFDKMTQVVPPKTTALTVADLALDGFTPVELLEGAYIPATDGNNKLLAAEQIAKQGIELPAIDRSAALTNVGVRQDDNQGRNAANAVVTDSAMPKGAQSDAVLQPHLAVPEVQKDETVVQMKQNNETVQQQQAANHTQQHSSQAWDRAAQATDRAYTMHPGAQAGNAADQVNVSIKHGLNTGIDRMIIQLDPADLGRVEIKMDVQDGRAQVLVTAEKSETLDLLQRDARSLERALAEAGLDTDMSGMEFELGGQENEDENADGDTTGTGLAEGTEEQEPELLSPEMINYTVSVEDGLNITV